MPQMAGDAKPERVVVIEDLVRAVVMDEPAGIVDPAFLGGLMELRSATRGVNCLGCVGANERVQ